MKNRTNLTWSAGKFVYPKGSSLPIHFMPLQDFSLEVALNYSLLIALRFSRLEHHTSLLSKLEIREWRHCLLTHEIVEMIKACSFSRPLFHDFGSDYALLFEEMKLAKSEIGNFEYSLHLSDDSHDHHLNTLHFIEDWPLRLHRDPFSTSSLDSYSVVIINTILGVRPQHDLPPCLELLSLPRHIQGCILAMRVCKAEKSTERTTVYGEDFIIPTLDSVLQWMSRANHHWYWQYLPNHDAEFFIPEPNTPDVGVLLAYSAHAPSKLPRFVLLDREGNI